MRYANQHGNEEGNNFVAIPDDKTKISLFLVTWRLRSLDNQVTEDRTSSFAPWFQCISSSQRNFKAPSKESAFPGGILLLSENPSLIGKSTDKIHCCAEGTQPCQLHPSPGHRSEGLPFSTKDRRTWHFSQPRVWSRLTSSQSQMRRRINNGSSPHPYKPVHSQPCPWCSVSEKQTQLV